MKHDQILVHRDEPQRGTYRTALASWRRRLEAHPKTGAAQLVEIRETVQEVLVPAYVEEKRPVERR